MRDSNSTNGMVASAHFLASEAGLAVLKDGGNAVDAAVAAATVIAVVAPHLNGVGADLFALVCRPGASQPEGLNASGRSGSLASVKTVRDRGFESMPVRGPVTITVPGAVSGWTALLSRYGTRSLRDIIGPAVGHARKGSPVTAKIAVGLEASREMLNSDSGSRAVFLPQDALLEVGQSFANPRLAASLEDIADTDGESFYRGDLARHMVADLKEAGGLLTQDDLASHRVEWASPLSTSFLGRTVYEMKPNSQGVAAIQMFNMAEACDVDKLPHNSGEYVARLAAVMGLVYEDRDRHVTDPDFYQAPLDLLTSKAYARERLASSHAGYATSDHGDTIYLCAADSAGLAVSLIQSNFMGFGSGFMSPSTGVHFQNRGASFSLDSNHVNRLEPRKRTRHTLIPAAALMNGRPEILFGSMGGDGQPQFQLQFLLNHLAFGMSIQQAIDAPRFLCVAGSPDSIKVEERFDPDVTRDLAHRGLDVEVVEAWSRQMGHAQAIRIDSASGAFEGGADPRGDGTAVSC